MQGPVVDLHIHHEARAVDRVEGQVFHASHAVALQAARDRCPHGAHMHRVFPVGFLGAAPTGKAQQIHAHRRHPVGTEAACFAANRLANLLLQGWIPTGTACHRHRKCGGAVVEHHAAGAIHKPQPLQSKPWQHTSWPGVAMGCITQGNRSHAWPKRRRSADQAKLLVNRELLDQSIDVRLDVASDAVHVQTLWRYIWPARFVARLLYQCGSGF